MNEIFIVTWPVDPPETEDPRARRRSRPYDPHSTYRTFGHRGASGMRAYVDPIHGLAIAHVGGLPINALIYGDSGLAPAQEENEGDTPN